VASQLAHGPAHDDGVGVQHLRNPLGGLPSAEQSHVNQNVNHPRKPAILSQS
jgi:hypothetical protein